MKKTSKKIIGKKITKKFAHSIRLSVFVHQGGNGGLENEGLIADALKKLSAANDAAFEKKKVEFSRTPAEGLGNEKIIILAVVIGREKYTRDFLENLLNSLETSQREAILAQAESRLDSEFAFYLRLDKDSLVNNRFVLTDTGNCFHIRIQLAVFPKKRDAALKLVHELFS